MIGKIYGKSLVSFLPMPSNYLYGQVKENSGVL